MEFAGGDVHVASTLEEDHEVTVKLRGGWEGTKIGGKSNDSD